MGVQGRRGRGAELIGLLLEQAVDGAREVLVAAERRDLDVHELPHLDHDWEGEEDLVDMAITRRSPTHFHRSTMTPACLAPSADSASRDQMPNRFCWLIVAPYSTWKSRWKSIGG